MKLKIDKSWTLFLDRDGVINERLPGLYIRDWKDFHFTEGALEAIAGFSKIFGKVIIVTNQQGLGKGLMSLEELQLVHKKMLKTIEAKGGKVDGIYYCPKKSREHPNCRKPDPFMAMQAQKDFPTIDFSRSVMVGDSIADIQFGNSLGMKTVWIEGKEEEKEQLNKLLSEEKIQIDFRFQKLADFYQHINHDYLI